MITREDLVQELPALTRFARYLVSDPDRADDLVQDTLVRAMERDDQHRSDAEIGPWLRRILHNLAIDRARRDARELTVEQVEDDWRRDEYTVDPDVVVERAADRRELEDGLARLPFMYRILVVLHDAEGLTVREIAKMEGIGLPAAKQRLRRGRMMLVSALAEGAERRHVLKGVPMSCWDARQHVSDYLDGGLDAATRETMERHLQRCPTCPPLYSALVGVRRELGCWQDADTVVPPVLAARIETVLTSRFEGP